MSDWSPFVAFVARHSTFLITTHIRPDGDALGSQLALAEALESLGKKVRCVVASPVPDRYAFMDPTGRVELVGADISEIDAVVVVDTGTWNQLAGVGQKFREMPVERFVIDHHQTQDDIGGERHVDTSAEACGRLVREAIAALHVALTPTMAAQLFTALATDTGWFRHTNTSPATFALASELMAAGANPSKIHEPIFESHPLPRLKLMARALDRLATYADGRIAAIEVYLSDYPATGSHPMDTEDLINYPRSLAGTIVALMFIEQAEGGVKVSFRSSSDSVDVSKIAEQFHGGGHRRASGATVKMPMAEARAKVLEAVEAALGAAK